MLHMYQWLPEKIILRDNNLKLEFHFSPLHSVQKRRRDDQMVKSLVALQVGRGVGGVREPSYQPIRPPITFEQ